MCCPVLALQESAETACQASGLDVAILVHLKADKIAAIGVRVSNGSACMDLQLILNLI